MARRSRRRSRSRLARLQSLPRNMLPGRSRRSSSDPRAAGGVDDPANLITLCDGCHAAHHPNLQGTLARRMIERWGLRLARALDFRHELAGVDESLGAAMRL